MTCWLTSLRSATAVIVDGYPEASALGSMFFFGSARDAVDLFYDDVIQQERNFGLVPELPRKAADEMTEEEVRTALTWVFMCHRKAKEQELAQEILDEIEKDYMEVIATLALLSPKYSEWASSPGARHINGDDPQKQKLYRNFIVAHCVENEVYTYHRSGVNMTADSRSYIEMKEKKAKGFGSTSAD